MKKTLLVIILSLFSAFVFAQLNMTQLGYVDLVSLHNSQASDIWAHVDSNNDEYAIVGLNDGTSVVYITDPANATEVFYQSGLNSIWRDIKTWNNHAFVTTEAQNGLLIINLNTLNGANPVNLSIDYYTGPVGREWQSAHNLYIDENGICYIFGANRDNGGCIMLDVNDPANIVELGSIENWYVHDGVARGDTLYLAHISDGFTSIWDISDKSTPVMLGTSATPGNLSHNVWFSDDGNHLYTTDEISGGYIGEYNVSDPTNIFETDRIQSSPGLNVIPHNVHFINDYLVTSYYRDGVTVHDVSNKGNMIEVGNFDTAPTLSGNGFNGCWGAYPWLPSGNIITSDIERGLHILGVNYQRACYLEGKVTDAISSAPINNVSVEILGISIADSSNIVGDYSMGYHQAGTYTVVFSNAGYFPDTAYNVVFTNGSITTQDMQLVPLTPVDITGNIKDLNSAVGIGGAQVVLTNGNTTYTSTTNANGGYTLSNVLSGSYTMLSGKWGHKTGCTTIEVDTLNDIFNLDLEEGYADDFALDLGWNVTSTTTTGIFEIADPLEVIGDSGVVIVPGDDLTADCNGNAYVTGNGSSQAGVDDVDAGFTQIECPSMDLTGYVNPYIHFSRYWSNSKEGSANIPDDTLRVMISDGLTDTVLVAFYQGDNNSNGTWIAHHYRILDFVSLTNNVRIAFNVGDFGDGHLVEAAIDGFSVVDSSSVGLKETDVELEVNLHPNPTSDRVVVETTERMTILELRTISGSLVHSMIPMSNRIQVELPSDAGIYILTLRSKSGAIAHRKVIKR